MFSDREKTPYHFGNIVGDYQYMTSAEADEFLYCHSINNIDTEFLKSNFDIMEENES
ncbi:MAG: hypothetical protein IKK55_01550 [Clostridia bacterium]|nr:hypothetical protein [Clostridia bacterium]